MPSSAPSTQLRPGFFARLIQKPTTPQSATPTDHTIHWIIHSNLRDWPAIFELADQPPAQLARSIKTFKHYLKHPASDLALISTIRLIVIVLLNSSDDFRLLAAKKLLKPVEDVLTKAAKSPHGKPIHDIILKAFSVLAYEFQHHGELAAFTKFYRKIKPYDAPDNGTPLDESGGLFAPVPADQTDPQSRSRPPPLPPANGLHQPPVTLVRDVRAEAEIARGHARLLLEALAFTIPSEMESNQIIQEFHSNCLQSQNQLMDDIPWATEQAARARDHLKGQFQQQQIGAYQPQSNSVLRPIGPTNDREAQTWNTPEEEILEVLLSANTELTAAFHQYSELERLAREEKEMKAVEERSKVETRHNRNSPEWLHTESSECPRQSGSSNPSPRHSILPDTGLPTAGSSEDVKFTSSKGYDVPDHSSSHLASSSAQSFDMQTRQAGIPGASSAHRPDLHDHQQLDSSQIVTPIERSEKALGKMRRISTGISHHSGPSIDVLHLHSDSLDRFDGSHPSSSSHCNSSNQHLHLY